MIYYILKLKIKRVVLKGLSLFLPIVELSLVPHVFLLGARNLSKDAFVATKSETFRKKISTEIDSIKAVPQNDFQH